MPNGKEDYITPDTGTEKEIKEDVEYAFPYENLSAVSKGMTLIDWFAGQALVGILSAHSKTTLDKELSSGTAYSKISEEAYNFAIAMMEERNKPAT